MEDGGGIGFRVYCRLFQGTESEYTRSFRILYRDLLWVSDHSRNMGGILFRDVVKFS